MTRYLSDINYENLLAIAKVAELENPQPWDHFLMNSPWAVMDGIIFNSLCLLSHI
ncbi:MAG: hypothetical protein ACKO24_15205 [Leptolyngbyaceae cyanobacterium]